MKDDGTIYRKIYNAIIKIAAFSVLAIGTSAFVSIFILRNNLTEISGKLGTSAAEDSMQALEEQAQNRLEELAVKIASVGDEEMNKTTILVSTLADYAENIVENPEDYKGFPILPPNAENEGVFSAQLRHAESSDPTEHRADIELLGNIAKILLPSARNNKSISAGYLGTQTGFFILVDKNARETEEPFDPRTRPWYQLAKEEKNLVWSETYTDWAGRGMSITCAAPYYKNEQLHGVVGIGVELSRLNEIVLDTELGEHGYTFLINEGGEPITPDESDSSHDSSRIMESLPQNKDTFLPITLESNQGVCRTSLDGADYFVSHAKLRELPFYVVAVMPVEEIISPAIESSVRIIQMKDGAIISIDHTIFFISIVIIFIALLIFVLGRILSKKLANRLAKPIIQLSDGAKIIGEGNLAYRLDVKDSKELSQLSQTFNNVIEQIKSITGEKKRIEAELDIARKIQSSMLPSIFPAFPNRKEFDINAIMIPAKEVGGDFYDFFFTDNDHLAMVIADVSGKGVPAALFMVIAKTLIKNNALYGHSPHKIFEIVNNLLCENNDESMFVTAFLGILEISTGKLIYVNAGHNPPLFKPKGEEYHWLDNSAGFVLAGMEGFEYTEHIMNVSSGDQFFFYTDGVTEAANYENQLFGEERLVSALNAISDSQYKNTIEIIIESIETFVENSEQTDDITMLVFKMKNSDNV